MAKSELLATDEGKFLPVQKLCAKYLDYVSSKRAERDEALEARRYYHGDQWSHDEVVELNKRRQPVITYNRESRKINSIVGLLERLRQDPKAYPRTPESGHGAEVATAVMNYSLDVNRWTGISPLVSLDASIEPVSGVELSLEPGDRDDPDVALHVIERGTFFYDPRSIRQDLSDARFMGISKLFDLDQAIEMFPDKEQLLRDSIDNGGDLNGDDQNRTVWMLSSAKKIRIVEIWYKRRGEWVYCFHTNAIKLDEGISPFIDEKGKTFSRFIVFSANVDHDGDRYGFHRNLKGPQDEINHRRSKGVHALNTMRLRVVEGSVNPDEVDKLREEVHRPDGVLQTPQGTGVEIISNAEQVQFNVEMLQEAKQEIENFGPNPALIGNGVAGSSGRAIALLQQAGIAELGPYILAWKDWKIRVYRALWNTVQRHWKSERWIRVTDDQGLAQFLQINGLSFDEFGQPALVNALGSLDVDIIVDEGPDHVNLMQDVFETLGQLASAGVPIPPQAIIMMSGLPESMKKQVIGMIQQAQQPSPAQQQAHQIELAGAAAEVGKKQADTAKTRADTAKTLNDIGKTRAETRKAHAEADDKQADTALKMIMPQPVPFGPIEQSMIGSGAGSQPASPF